MERSFKLSRPQTWIVYFVLLVLCLLWVVPIFTLVATAIKSKKDFFSGLSLFDMPSKISWSNFTKALTTGNLLVYMKNDLIICCLKVPLGILIESMAAFALTRLKMRRPTGVFIFFLIGMMLPMQVALVPISIVFNKLDLFNTYFGLFYIYVGFGISFGVLVMRGFFISIPREMDEAAYIDGCNRFQLYSLIMMPLAKPAIATLLISDFLATWNEYMLANVIINNTAMKTVPPGLMTFVGQYGTDYGGLCAGVLVSIVPVMVVYLVFQKYFVQGMAGAIKA